MMAGLITCPMCDGWSPSETGMNCDMCGGDGAIWDDEPDGEDECDCSEHECLDPLTGAATCNRCGSRRYLSPDQIKRIEAAQAEYDARIGDEN